MEEILGDILLAWNVDIIRPRMLSLIMKIIDSVPMMTTWPLLVEERVLVSERGPGCAGSPSLTHTVQPRHHLSAVQCSEAQSTWRYRHASTCSHSPRPGLRNRPVLIMPRSLRTPALPPRAVLRQVLQVRQRWDLVLSHWKGWRLEHPQTYARVHSCYVLCSKIIRKWLTIFQSMPCCHDTCWWCRDGKEVQISGLTVSFGCFEWHTWLPLPTNCLWIYSIDYMCKGRFPVWNKYS